MTDLLKERNVAIVLIDGPGFPITHKETADHSYVRFHGRNYDIWYSEESEGDQRINRYDYLYSVEQLDNWVPRIKEAEKDASRVRVFFNNHGWSKAVRNTFEMMDLLRIEHRSKEIKLQDQSTISDLRARHSSRMESASDPNDCERSPTGSGLEYQLAAPVLPLPHRDGVGHQVLDVLDVRYQEDLLELLR